MERSAGAGARPDPDAGRLRPDRRHRPLHSARWRATTHPLLTGAVQQLAAGIVYLIAALIVPERPMTLIKRVSAKRATTLSLSSSRPKNR